MARKRRRARKDDVSFHEHMIEQLCQTAAGAIPRMVPSVSEIQFLGRGSYGCAFLVKSGSVRRVLKFTTDLSEAAAAHRMCASEFSHPHVVSIHAVSPAWKGVFLIEQEYLPIHARQIPGIHLYDEAFGEVIKELERRFRAVNQESVRVFSRMIVSHPSVLEDDHALKIARSVASACTALADELGIFWLDAHINNIRASDNRTVEVIDIGVSGTVLEKSLKLEPISCGRTLINPHEQDL